MIDPIAVIVAEDATRDTPLEQIVEGHDVASLLSACDQLDAFRRVETNLYHRVRALFFLSAIHRYHLPPLYAANPTPSAHIPHRGYEHLLNRRFLEAIDAFLSAARTDGFGDAISSGLADAYHRLGLQTLADQVRRSVREVAGNRWMFRMGHPADHPLTTRPELIATDSATGLRPVLHETTAVRMDVSHSAWSDIFFLGMDYPDGAKVLNISVDLAVRPPEDEQGVVTPKPPIETFFRIIDTPVIRLTSVDLETTADVASIAEMFDFGRDYLGLLKAAVIAAGIVPPGLEGSGEQLSELLETLVGPGLGIELVSQINNIPKGSRLAVSTNLLGSLIAVCMRATGQVDSIEGNLSPQDRHIVAARAILGEWIGGSGGGWQDSGGVWPGIKQICGTTAQPGDPEHGISRGRLMPTHDVMDRHRVDDAARKRLADSLIVVHGGMASNVGPILEMVTEHYLLRSAQPWRARGEALAIFDDVVSAVCTGDAKRIGALTTKNFTGPIQDIIPWATNHFTDTLIERCRDQWGDRFWGFWMLGGMAGGGMGFIFDPSIKHEAGQWLGRTMRSVKQTLERGVPFAMDPVVYEFSINDNGSRATMRRGGDALISSRYYAMRLPVWLRTPPRDWTPDRRAEIAVLGHRRTSNDKSESGNHIAIEPAAILGGLMPASDRGADQSFSMDRWLDEIGLDRVAHDQIRDDLLSGRIGLRQNRLPGNVSITDVKPEHVEDLQNVDHDDRPKPQFDDDHRRGLQAMRAGEVAAVTLAAGVGSRWTGGAGVAKAINPFAKFAGRHRTFLEVHLAKNRKTRRRYDCVLPHVVTTSRLTDDAIRDYLERHDDFGMKPSLYVSTGKSLGLRLVPTVADLRFQWEETVEQALDEQQEKMRGSVRAALLNWVRQVGEASDYLDNVPEQCIHPIGHWYEVPNLMLSGVLADLIDASPNLRHLMLHNIDTLGATIDPIMLGRHINRGNFLNFEVMRRRLEDRGGGLALVGGRPRLVEGLAMPREDIEFDLTYYNSMTTWIDIDQLLAFFELSRSDLRDQTRIASAVRRAASRMPTYVTIKDVKKRWGRGQEDVYPVAQFEKLWGDMSSLPEVSTGYFAVDKTRGGQMKEVAQLDPWLRDGTAAQIESLCDFNI